MLLALLLDLLLTALTGWELIFLIYDDIKLPSISLISLGFLPACLSMRDLVDPSATTGSTGNVSDADELEALTNLFS